MNHTLCLSLKKFEVPAVTIRGPIRSCLKAIFDRIPHWSAASASREIAQKPEYEYNMVVLYNVNEERCKRLWATWAKEKTVSGGRRKLKIAVGAWDQWTVHRLRAIAEQLGVKGAGHKNLNKAQIKALLPPWTEALELEVQTVSKRVQKDKDEDGDICISDGELEDDDAQSAHNITTMAAGNEDKLAEIIALMAPPPPPANPNAKFGRKERLPPKKRKPKNQCTKEITKRRNCTLTPPFVVVVRSCLLCCFIYFHVIASNLNPNPEC